MNPFTFTPTGLSEASPSKFVNLGLVSFSASVTVNVTGTTITSSTGNVTIAAAAAVSATGSIITSSTGTVSITGTVVVSVTGTTITSSVGSVTDSGSAVVSITGSVITSSTGTVTETGTAVVSATGSTVTSSVHSVSESGGAIVSATGSILSASTGNTSETGTAVVSITGSIITATVGSVTVFAGGNVTVNVTGSIITGTVHSVSESGSAIVSVVGSSVSSVTGSVTESGSATVSITESAISGTVHSVSVTTTGGAVVVNPIGSVMTIAVGTVSVSTSSAPFVRVIVPGAQQFYTDFGSISGDNPSIIYPTTQVQIFEYPLPDRDLRMATATHWRGLGWQSMPRELLFGPDSGYGYPPTFIVAAGDAFLLGGSDTAHTVITVYQNVFTLVGNTINVQSFIRGSVNINIAPGTTVLWQIIADGQVNFIWGSGYNKQLQLSVSAVLQSSTTSTPVVRMKEFELQS